jgi:hypothetical protein
MNTQTQVFNPNTNTVLVQGERVLIARESDFMSFIEEAPREKVFGLKQSLETVVRQFGEVRSPAADLMRMRLRQLRNSIAQLA